MSSAVSIYEAQEIFNSQLSGKINAFFAWLKGIENALDDKGLECSVYVIYEQPFTLSGPFLQVPKAIVTAKIASRVDARPQLLGAPLSLQHMMDWGGEPLNVDGFPKDGYTFDYSAKCVERYLRNSPASKPANKIPEISGIEDND